MAKTKARRPVDLNGTVMGDGSYLLCVPITGVTSDGIIDEVTAAVAKKADMLEWRIDAWEKYPDIDEALSLLSRIRDIDGKIPILLTTRSKREGPNPDEEDISDDDKFALIDALANTGLCEAFDVEYFYGKAVISAVSEKLHKKNCKLLVSLHVKSGVLDASGIEEVLSNMQDWGGDIAKLCVFNETFADFFWFINRIKDARDSYIDIPMVTAAAADNTGISRALGDVWGTDMIFVTSDGSRQPGIEELRKFRDMIW